MIRRLQAGASLVLLFALTLAPARGDETNAAPPVVVQLFVTHQSHDSSFPWQRRPPAVRSGYAVAVGPRHLLTTESLVRHGQLVEYRLPRRGTRFTARRRVSDVFVNLALLETDTPLPGWTAPDDATILRRGDALTFAQFDETLELQQGPGRVVQFLSSAVSPLPGALLTAQALVEINLNAEGVPAMRQGRLAGLVLNFDRGTRMATLLPADLLARFVAQAAGDAYAGFPIAGFMRMPLTDPTRRRHLGVAPDAGGILVVAPLVGLPIADVLKPQDVILTWDGHPLDDLGFYDDPAYGRLDFAHLVTGRHHPGASVPVEVIRNAQRQTLTVQVERPTERSLLVPYDLSEQPPEYLIAGGLVLRDLTGAYLMGRGDWQRRADPRLVHLYLSRRFTPDWPGQRVPILSFVLPDDINVGYQHISDEVILACNGQPVHGLGDIFDIQARDGAITRLTLQGVGTEIVLPAADLPAANRRIAEAYGLPALAYRRPAPPAAPATAP